MPTVLIISIFVVILAFLARYNNVRYLFEFAFFIIFIFTAFRFNYGTDYANYHEIFNTISNYTSIHQIHSKLFLAEPAWLILNYIFKPIGFFGFIIVLSAFLCYTFYSLIKKYVDPKYYWMAVFIYVFSVDLMWIQFSAIRQALSIAIFIHSVKYLNEKRHPLVFITMNLFGGLFHSSAYLMVPLVVFSFKRIKKSKLTGLIIWAVFWFLLFWGEMYLSQIKDLTILLSGDRYTSRFTHERDFSPTLIGSIAWGTLLSIVIYYARYQKENKKNLFYLTSLHSMVYVIGPLIWLAARMGYYFAPFSIVAYPLIMQHEKNKILKTGIFTIFTIYLLYRLTNFFELDWVISGYSKYQTILYELF